MIKINEEMGEIYFYHPIDLVKQYPDLYNSEVYEFKLLSAHICPVCHNILDAFYIGTLPIENSVRTCYTTHPYQHRKSASYSVTEPHYTYGHKDGGGYLIMSNHNDTLCKHVVAREVGVTTGIKSLIDPKTVFIPTDGQIKTFAEDVRANKYPGFYLIPDICGKREPLLAFDKETYAQNAEGYTVLDKEYKWEVVFASMVAGVQEAPTTSEPTVQHTPKPNKRTVNEMIYSRLQEIGIIDENGAMQADYMKFVCGGLMPLSVDNLGRRSNGVQYISLAHNGKQNGDIMADPDMEVRVWPESKTAEALTFQNDYVGVFQEVYNENGVPNHRLKTELDAFLNSWLKRMIKDQQYVLEPEVPETDEPEATVATTVSEVTEVIEPEPAPKPVRKYNNTEAAYLSCIDNPSCPEYKAELEVELGPDMVQLLKEVNEEGKADMVKHQEEQLQQLKQIVAQVKEEEAQHLANNPEPEPEPVSQVPTTCSGCGLWNPLQKPPTANTMGICREQCSKFYRKFTKGSNVCVLNKQAVAV